MKTADAYVLSTEKLLEELDFEYKKFAICHGTYQIEKERNVMKSTNKTHVVYAGTFDPDKGEGTT